MITIQTIEEQKRPMNNENNILVELRGLSTDEKPLEINGKVIENGSSFIEIDTGKIYMYDLENQEWNEV